MNTINTSNQYSDLNLVAVDRHLPFDGKIVWLWDIRHTKTGYGHWKLSLDIEVDGERTILTKTTTEP